MRCCDGAQTLQAALVCAIHVEHLPLSWHGKFPCLLA